MLPARANPFRMERIERLRFRLDDAGWHGLMTRFAAQRRRGVLVGPHGSGKTTLREEIERRLQGDGWRVQAVVLRDDGPATWAAVVEAVERCDAGTVLSLDGLDRIGRWRWWGLRGRLRAVGGVLATSHAPGRLPLLHRHRTSVGLLGELAGELLAPSPADAHLHARCQELFTRHRGDVRACLRALYDEAADGVLPSAALPAARHG